VQQKINQSIFVVGLYCVFVATPLFSLAPSMIIAVISDDQSGVRVRSSKPAPKRAKSEKGTK
jgi:hypothetical protein